MNDNPPVTHPGPSKPPSYQAYFIGLGGGAGVTLLMMAFAFMITDGWGVMYVAEFAKFVAGIVLILIPHRRQLGAGLLTSVPVGVIVAFCTCLATFELHIHP